MGGKGLRAAASHKGERMKTRLWLLSAVLISCSFLLASCGYTTRSLIATRYSTVCVEPFSNKIDIAKEAESYSKYTVYKPLLESDVTRKVIDRYIFDGNLKPTDKETADLILSGEIVEFRRQPLRYTDSDNVEEYRLSIVVNMRLKEADGDRTLWQENNFAGEATYFTTGAEAKSEEAAIADAVDDLARRIVERTVDQW